MLKLLGSIIQWIAGWRFEGEVPAIRKYVIVAAPHTSNWDLLYMLALGGPLGLRPRWMGKKEIFDGPLGFLARWLGGIRIDRSGSLGTVGQIVEQLEAADDFVLAVSPEGTRGYRDHWKSGFYHIAVAAQVPIVLGFLDYRRKRGGLGPALYPTGDLRADMDSIRAFYQDIVGRHPEKFGPIRLREENEQG
jgi:1-acyl-sn-glycerol-3-phosphate acyltransferase